MAGARRHRRQRRDDESLFLLLSVRQLRRERSSGGSVLWVLVLAACVLGFATLVGAGWAPERPCKPRSASALSTGGWRNPFRRRPSSMPGNGYYLGAIPAPIHRQPVRYGAMSPWIRKATVAAEDRTFWANDGLDFAGIARAAVADLAAGQAVQGASTITQQLVRNRYLGDDKTLARKRLEACLALTTVTWVGYPLRTRSMSNVHGIQVQGGSFPAHIWHEYMSRTLGHIKPRSFVHGGWQLAPYRGPRSMRHPPKKRG